ncbi:Membrane protein of ER body-like protein [Trema orientale]|uniref:Membrane protein of ER body-like protein n=1 Tax=Trema orientale TaxID=63057 RepID=A0A2P5CEC9_TREOI|nr:Membrane protein of ER body-like protein [Trema orientale]
MEVMRQWEEVEAEAEKEDVALRGRVPRHHTTTAAAITTSKDGGSSSSHHESSDSSSSEDESSKNEKVTGKKSSTGISHEGNGGTKSSNGHYGLQDGVVDLPISKENPVDQILDFEDDSQFPLLGVASNLEIQNNDSPAFGPSSSQKSSQEENGVHADLNNGKTEYSEADLRDKSIEELRELYLAKLCEKPGPHEFYCPNCKTCITKVYVREVEIRPSTPPRTEPVERVICTSCFSFLLIPAGWLFPNWSIANRGGTDTDEGEPVPSSSLHGQQHNQNSQTVPAKSPAPNQSGVGVSATINPTEDISGDSTGLNLVLPVNKTEIISGQSDRTPVPEEPIPVNVTLATNPVSNNSDNITGLGEQAPSNNLNGIPRDRKPWLVGSVGAIVSAITKPLGNNSENSVNLQVPVPHDKIPTVPDIDVTPNVETKPSTSEIDEDVSTPKPVQLPEVIARGTKLDGAVVHKYTGPAQDGCPDAITINIGSIQTPLLPRQRSRKTWEIVKSIVYGGLAESITSLGIVTSAASGDATTLNILALALANLLGGLFIIGHNLWELKDDRSKIHSIETEEHVDRYQEVLGKRENFVLHAFFAVLSFLVFGLVPPVVYGFSFRQSDNKDLKLAAVAAASLICITILSFAKAYTQKPSKYIKTVTYYVVVGLGVSGASYLAGELINQLLEKLNWSESTPPTALPLVGMGAGNRSWQSS